MFRGGPDFSHQVVRTLTLGVMTCAAMAVEAADKDKFGGLLDDLE